MLRENRRIGPNQPLYSLSSYQMQFASRFIFGCVLLIVVPLLENNPYSTTNGDETPANATDSNPDTVSFHQDIDPIFSRHCYGCHQGAKATRLLCNDEF